MDLHATSPFVSIQVTAGNSPQTYTRDNDLKIGKLFFTIMTGAATVMSLLGFIVTGHPLLLASTLALGIITISVFPSGKSHYVHREFNSYSSYPPVPQAISTPTISIPYPYVVQEPAPQAPRPRVTVHHPVLPAELAPTQHQVRAPVGARVRDVYHTSPPASPDHNPYVWDTPSSPIHNSFQDPRVVGTGATARAKIGRN
jgi:hypothetical protein